MERPAGLALEGIRIVAIEQAVAAPFCTSRLADAGAQVVKIEREGGDFARGYDDVCGGESSYFVWLNRGKDSLVLDFTAEPGREVLWRLIDEADVLVQNLKPGALERAGFGIEALRARNPGLITCSISGYGATGPMAQRKAYDMLVQAESGLASITGGPEAPARVGISIVDIATGVTAYAAILEALLKPGRAGEGANIEVSMFDVMADWLTVPLLHHSAGKAPKRIGLAHPSIAPYGVFRTKDGREILIAIQSDREWRQFAIVFLGAENFARDGRFDTNVNRVANRVEMDELIAAKFASLTSVDSITLLEKADIAFASLNDMAALSDHPHLRCITVDTAVGPVSYPAPAPIGLPRSFGPVPPLAGPERAATFTWRVPRP